MQELSRDNFNEVINSPGPILIDFWSPSCRVCLNLMAGLERLSEQYPWLTFYKCNIANMRRLAMAEGVMGLPNIRLYKDGNLLTEMTGEELTARQIEENIQAWKNVSARS